MIEVIITFHGSVFLRDARPIQGKTFHQCHQLTSIQNLIDYYSLIPNVRVSVNGELINDVDKLFNPGDEIHFFRPVSGG